MASGGSATAGLRHSFMAPGASDRATAKKVARTPSMPTHKSSAAALDRPSGGGGASRARTKRASGLFESSDSGSDAADHEPSPTERRQQRKSPPPDAPPATTRHHSLPGRENSANNERKGLFEFDDDAADSVETLRERVKLRQKKKEHEMDTLRGELESALARAAAVSAELTRERKEKEEFAIRMDECQRIIEKRNKQLIKASEKLVRLAEQSENQTSELQQRIQELQQELEQARALERVALERQRAEFEEKLAQQRARLESQMENVTLAAAEKLRMKEADELQLHKRITQLEADVVGTTSRMFESSEYQNLLKRCEDAEAITRGLRFQLEKAQNEKKYLKKQLVAVSASTSPPAQTGSTPSPAFLPAVDLFTELSAGREQSPTSSVASADLSSFDFSRTEMSPPMSPVGTSRPPPATVPPSSSSSSSSRKPSLKVSTGLETLRRVHIDEPNRGETSSKDSLESVYGGTNDGDEEEAPPMPPLTTSQSDRSEGRTRPGSGSINFFEKISIKFKRSASSPRTSTPTTRSFDEAEQKATTPAGHPAGGASSQSQPPGASSSTPIDIPPAHRRKVLPKRPKMYVAKSLSDYEESSDSIFGSDSESDVPSDEDDQPPPPPPNGLSRSPTGSVDTSSAAMPPPPPPPPLFADASEDEGDSSSDGSEERSTREDLRRVILPTPVSPPVVAQDQTRTERSTTKMAPSQSSSADSDSEHSASSDGERNVKASQPTTSTPVRVAGTPKAHRAPSSSESELEEPTRRSEKHRRRVGMDDASGVRAPSSKASAEPRKEKRERSRSTEGDAGTSAAAKVNRMNEYMEARARKRQEKLSKKEEKEIAESKKREEYEKEWERMAEEERERRRKQQKARRTGKRRPSSMKTVRVSQMRHQMNKHHKDAFGAHDETGETKGDDSDDENGPPQPDTQRAGYQSSDSDSIDEETEQQRTTSQASSPPLPPEPTAVNTDLYLRQQARLREHHEMELKKKQDSEEADQVRGQIHRRVEMWAFAKELHHMILTLDQISSNEALKQCQLMVVQSPDPETLRKAYRNIIRVIHPDKLRNATITEQLEAKELFTVLNQAFEKFKAQQQ